MRSLLSIDDLPPRLHSVLEGRVFEIKGSKTSPLVIIRSVDRHTTKQEVGDHLLNLNITFDVVEKRSVSLTVDSFEIMGKDLD